MSINRKTGLALALLLLSPLAMAQTELLVGKFGHEHTAPKNTPVWEIKETSDDQYQFVTLGVGEPSQPAHEFSADERRKFWQTMWWPEDTSDAAICIGNEREIMCYVPPETRNGIDWLKDHKSHYFYYDSAAGVMETHKLTSD